MSNGILRQILLRVRADPNARIVARCIFWVLLSAIVLFSIVPPSERPVTRVPHAFEHVGIFLLLGVSFAAGYRVQWASIISLMAFTAGVEIMQFFAPGRHPRWSDLLENIVGLVVGIALIYFVNRLMDRFGARPNSPGERSVRRL
jgi:VanZ family protein